MRSHVARLCLHVAGLAALAVFCLHPAVVAAPSAALSAALDTELADVNKENATLHQQVQGLLSRARDSGLAESINIGIEYDDSQPEPRGNLAVRDATMRQQLDAVANGVGYVWQADGDCINLIPKGKCGDAKWVLNQVMEGEIVLSREGSVATPVKDWFTQRRITGMRDLHQFTIRGFRKILGPDPIVLHNPTLRQYGNALERMFGNNMWSREVKVLPARNAETAQRTLLISWGQGTRLVAEPESAPAAPKPQQ